MTLTTSPNTNTEWESILDVAGVRDLYAEHRGEVNDVAVIDFLLRDPLNPSNVLSLIEQARTNARLVRTALTREVWEATNDAWRRLGKALSAPVDRPALPDTLALVRQESALVRGAQHGTMLRNDIYSFCRMGTFIERADNTARILDVKYDVLLPTHQQVGSATHNAQWETVLRALSAQRAYHWQCAGQVDSRSIVEFVILDSRMPHSLAFCYRKMAGNLGHLCFEYAERMPSHDLAVALHEKVSARSIGEIFTVGLHDFLLECSADTQVLAAQFEHDYRFTR